MTFYAQCGEDKWMSEREMPYHGFFVEVGAGDGIRFSNTKWLEDWGWDGLLIEPDPRQHDAIRANRKAKLIPCAVGSEIRDFHLHYDPLLSGFLAEGSNCRVPTRGLTSILEEYNVKQVDVLSIDTEGTELEVWATLDLAKYRPAIVFAEWDTCGVRFQEKELREQFAKDGYKCAAKLGCNLVFTRDE